MGGWVAGDYERAVESSNSAEAITSVLVTFCIMRIEDVVLQVIIKVLLDSWSKIVKSIDSG